MARVQTDYRPQGTGLQAVGIPTIQPEVARNDPNSDSAMQLAKALGAINTDGLNASIRQAGQAYNQDAERQAREYANSMTLEGLGKAIKDGTILPSQSPAFKATLEHIYGENMLDSFQRDTVSKLQRGELKFDNPADLEKYVTDYRNQALAGASPFTISGYDRGFNQVRQGIMDANTRLVDKQAVERGVQEATDNIGNVILDVTSPTFKGTPQDAARAVIDRYQLLGKTSLLRDDARKEALQGAISNIASSGNKELVGAMLDSKLDSGLTVRAVLGEQHAIALTNAADRQYDQAQRQRVDVELRPFVEQAGKGELDRKSFDEWVGKNEKYVTTPTMMAIINHNQAKIEQLQKQNAQNAMLSLAEQSQAQATQAVHTAIEQGGLAFLPQQKVVTPQGEQKDFDHKKAAQAYMTERVAASNMPFGKQVEFWSTNGVENPEWQKQIQGGVSNIASVGWTYDGKNIGTINPQGQAALDTFMRINAVNPGYAQSLTGSDKDYKMLSDIQFLTERFNMPLSDAAARVNQIQRAGIGKDDYGALTKKVQAAVDNVVSPHWYSGVANWWNGLWGNSNVNLTAVRADLGRMAELLVKSGQVPDADAAVKAATEYLADPKITTKINNTVYFNKDLPTFPTGEDPTQLMERFIKEGPGQIAAQQQQKASDVRLEPNQYGGFTAWVGGVPLITPDGKIVTYQKDDISKWANDTLNADRHKAADEANYQAYKTRIGKELRALQGKDQYALVKYDSTLDHSWFEKEILSKEAYQRNLKEGIAGKPLSELFSIYKARRTQGQ